MRPWVGRMVLGESTTTTALSRANLIFDNSERYGGKDLVPSTLSLNNLRSVRRAQDTSLATSLAPRWPAGTRWVACPVFS